MTKLQIAAGLAIPPEAVTEAIGWIGRRGSGKSYAAQKLAEEFHRAKAQFVVLDPVGNWYGLRLAANGRDAGIPIPVFGGLQGDVPIEPSAGKVIADTIVDRGISAVIDVSQFESDADKARFARAFCERFYFRKKSAPSAVHLFLEEAQEFIPQNPGRDEPLMLHAFTRLAKLGRNFGIGISMISQRPQEVNKKVLNLTELLFAFQLTGTHERKAVEAWIGDKGLDEDIEAELPKLERGKPHVWSPAWLKVSRVVEISAKWTLDASSTPKVGAGAAGVRELSPIDLEKLRTDMAATIEKAKADDPKELKREIASLRAQLTKGSAAPHHPKGAKPVLDQAAIDRAVAKALGEQRTTIANVDRQRNRLLTLTTKHLEEIGSHLHKVAANIGEVAGVKVEFAAPPSTNGNSVHAAQTVHAPVNKTRPVNKTAPKSPREPVEGLSRGQQKILNALAELHAIGIESTTRQQLGMFAGYNLTGGSGAQHIADLVQLGLAEIPGQGSVQLTEAGHAAADATDVPGTLSELHARVLAKTSSGQRRIAEHLIEIYPDAITRADLGAAVGYNLTGGSGAQHVADLVTLGAACIPRQGQVAASDLLFPEGLS